MTSTVTHGFVSNIPDDPDAAAAGEVLPQAHWNAPHDVSIDHADLTDVTATQHHDNANDPSSGEKAALAGTSGTPGALNKYVTDADSRLTDSRAPTGSAGGDLSGTYPNPAVVDDSHGHTGATVTTTDAPSGAAVSIDAAPSAGAGTAVARATHGHQVTTTDAPSGANVTIDGAPSAGSTGAIARATHGHRLNTYSSNAAAIGTASAGTSAQAPSRGDHVHPTGAGTPSTQAFGDAAATGTGPAAAMTDHKHAMPANPTVLTLPTVYAVGASATSAGGNITPGLPTGHTTNDILLLICQTSNQALTAPAGYAQYGPHNGFGGAAAAGSTRIYLFWKRDGGSESDPTVTGAADHTLGVIVGIRGAPTTGDPFLSVGCARKTTASTTATGRAGATPIDACLWLDIFGDALDSTSARYSSPTNASLGSVTEQVDIGTTDGTGGGIGVVSGTKATAGSVSATTATMTSGVNVAISLLVLPAGITSRAGFIDIQEFLTTVAGTAGADTWTKPTGAKRARGTAIGGGASGSAGRNAATAAGGGGGGGGGYGEHEWSAGEGAATMTITIGAGGNATANSDGAASNAGNYSAITDNTKIICYAPDGLAAGVSATGSGGLGGNGAGLGSASAAGVTTYDTQRPGGGTGGTTAGAGGSGLGTGTLANGGAGAGGGTSQAASAGGNSAHGGAGGGGGRSNTNVGTGGLSIFGSQLAGGATAGANGTDSPYYEYGGSGAAGGTSAAGPGGTGGWPGGGGGGGGSQSGAQRGGAGGDGVVVITSYM